MTRLEWLRLMNDCDARAVANSTAAIDHAQAGRQVRAALHGLAAGVFNAAYYAATAGMIREHGPEPMRESVEAVDAEKPYRYNLHVVDDKPGAA